MDYSKPYVTCTEKGTQRVHYLQGGKKFTAQDLAKAKKNFVPKVDTGDNQDAPQRDLPKAKMTVTRKVPVSVIDASESPAPVNLAQESLLNPPAETPVEEAPAETPVEEADAQVTTEPIKKYKNEGAAKAAMTREGLDKTAHRVIPYEGEFVIEEI